MKLFRWLAVLCMVSMTCHAAEVQRVYSPGIGEVSLSIAVPACRLEWIIYEREANRGLIKHRPDCVLPLIAQQPLLSALLSAALSEPVLSDGIKGFSFGRLIGSPELSRRLSLAAWRARDWDARHGRPQGGDENGFVVMLAERASIYTEMAEVFAARGLRLRFRAAEKVLIMPVAGLQEAVWLEQQGVPADARLPYDCMAWFDVVSAR